MSGVSGENGINCISKVLPIIPTVISSNSSNGMKNMYDNNCQITEGENTNNYNCEETQLFNFL